MKDKIFNIIGAAMAVHNELKKGFLESVYQEALAIEFSERGIPFEKEKLINVYYRGNMLKQYYRTDFLCYDSVIVEIKAVALLANEHIAQTLNYMRATQIEKGLLINFGEDSLKFKSLIL